MKPYSRVKLWIVEEWSNNFFLVYIIFSSRHFFGNNADFLMALECNCNTTC